MEVIIATLIIFLGAYIQTALGFGLAIVAAPILFLLDPLYVPAPITMSALTLSLVMALSHWKSISFSGLKFAILGRIPGTICGGMLLVWISVEQLALWVGISVIVAVILSLSNLKLKPSTGSLFSAGFLSGFMGTSTSIGGPPMALLLQHEKSEYIRANMSAFFCASCLMSLVMLLVIGKLYQSHIFLFLPFIPATLIGYWLAMKTVRKISHNSLRYSSLTLCMLAGLMTVASYWQ